MASQSGTSSGPFTVTVSNLPFGSEGLISISVQRLTCPRQRPFRPSHQGWYPASYPRRSTEGPTMSPRFPAAFRLPAFASWASCPAEGFRPPHGRPTRHSPGPRRGFHVPHIRVTAGLGALFTPRPSGALARAPAKSGLDFLSCGDAAQHAGDGRLLGRHGPGDDHEGSSRHLLITKHHARCHHRPRTPSLTSSTRTSSPTYQKHRRRYWPR